MKILLFNSKFKDHNFIDLSMENLDRSRTFYKCSIRILKNVCFIRVLQK